MEDDFCVNEASLFNAQHHFYIWGKLNYQDTSHSLAESAAEEA